MNVFVTSVDPVEAAVALCNKHIVKMALESAQLLSNAHEPGVMRYRHTHQNHPCSLWVKRSLTNYKWLCVHALAICEEYTRRYDKVHASEIVIDECSVTMPSLPEAGLTPFARALKQPWKDTTAHLPVELAYRKYYLGDKQRFAQWAPRAHAPAWWPKPNA